MVSGDRAETSEILVHDTPGQIALIGPQPNTFLTILVHRTGGRLRFDIARCGAAPHPRTLDAIGYISFLHQRAVALGIMTDGPSFLFQAEDNPVDVPSVSWERQKGWSKVRLIPDIYYYQAQGYAGFLNEIPPWRERKDKLVWRGATTGILHLTFERLEELPRYRFVRAARRLGAFADVGLNAVAQHADETEGDRIRTHLHDEGLAADFLPLVDMRFSRYVVEIDGNANSWNLVQRLRLGACMLKVESEWEQWFSDRLQPWRHFVPVSSNLTDLAARIHWCRRHPHEAERIASEGRAFAAAMNFDIEMEKAARLMFGRNT